MMVNLDLRIYYYIRTYIWYIWTYIYIDILSVYSRVYYTKLVQYIYMVYYYSTIY